MLVSVLTRGLAILNPISYPSSNTNLFVIKYYTWQNLTVPPTLSPTLNNNYCYLIINQNLASTALTYITYNYNIGNFNYITYPHVRYYLDTPFNSLVHRAPFEMRFYPSVAFTASSGTNYHSIKIVFPSTFGASASFNIKDTTVFRPVCYLNNYRIRQCSLVGTTAILMQFTFALATATRYHLKMSILDSRNPDINGFLASVAVSNVVLMYQPYGAATWQYT
jgi:hypothetical protein